MKPNRQLRSKVLKKALSCYIIPPFLQNYEVVGVRALLKNENDNVWEKRRILEATLNNDEHVVAFFSCITAIEGKKKPKKRKIIHRDPNESEEEENEEEASDNDELSIIPGVSFWVVFDWPQYGLAAYEERISKHFMESGVDLINCKAVRGRGSKTLKEYSTASLFIVLKDHDCEHAKTLTVMSQTRSVRGAASSQGYDMDYVHLKEGEDYSSMPAQLFLTERIDFNVAKEVKDGLEKIKHVKLKLKLVDYSKKDSNNVETVSVYRPTSKFMQAVDVVRRFMTTHSFGLRDGSIYIKPPDATFTFVFVCSVRKFLLTIVGNPEIADQIATYVNPIANLLEEPACRLLKPIEIDFNYIEVLPEGTLFDIAGKKFTRDHQKLRGSPRAFVSYVYNKNKDPNPKPFIQGVENSFPNDVERKLFYQKYYQLLLHGQFPMKEPKMILVGPADSGKTSWFCPFEGIIPSKYISAVVNDGKFSGHMINSATQIVIMDEWTSNSLSCEDAKRILQGGLFMVPQKHKEAARVHYKSGFFITTNVYPDFGAEADCEAIRKRLSLFNTRALPQKNCKVSAWLRKHCMVVFHYVANQLKDVPLFESTIEVEDDEFGKGSSYNDFDNDPIQLLLSKCDESFCYSQSSNAMENETESTDIVPQDAIDNAVLEADRVEGILYDHLAFESECFDCTSEATDAEYIEKVYRIASYDHDAWKNLDVSEETVNIFEMRRRSDWHGADSVYDAWLIANKYRRSWFRYDMFFKRYPDYEIIRQRLHEQIQGDQSEEGVEVINENNTASGAESDQYLSFPEDN